MKGGAGRVQAVNWKDRDAGENSEATPADIRAGMDPRGHL